MNKFVLAGVSAAAVLAGAYAPAMAADLPRKSAPPAFVAAPVFTWTGFYAGINLGYGFNDNRSRVVGNPAFTGTFVTPGFVPGSADTGADGFVGGGQIGYNYQFNQFVLGLEADIQYTDLTRSRTFVSAGLGGTTTSLREELGYLGTVRARIGFVPVDRWLVYATGGLAYGDVSSRGTVSTPALLFSGSRSETEIGYAVGGGVEYAITDNLTVKGEYLYYDLGSRNYNLAPLNAASVATGAVGVVRSESSGSIVRAGLNYKF